MKTLATTLDSKAMTLTSEFLKKEAEILVVLQEMYKKKLFPELNYSGVFDYCERRLGLSRAQSYYYKSVVEKSEEVPELKEAVLQGELTLSEARRIAPVITPENKTEWFQKAKDLNQVELERAVKEVNPRAHITERIRPVAKDLRELRAPISAKTESELERLKDLLSQKLGRAASLEEVIAWAVSECREKHDPERKLARRRISSGNSSPQPGSHAIPASVKHEVVLRQGFQCTHLGTDGRRCHERRWLHFHHLREVANGGLNTPENLRLLCSAHHRLWHRTVSPQAKDAGVMTRWR